MREFRPVSVSRNAFIFCRYFLAVIFWAALFIQTKELVLAGFLILLLSAILKVGRAPLIVFYTYTIERIFKGSKEILDEKGMRFAHGFGSLFSLICVLLLYAGYEKAGWILTAFLCIAKTAGALGFCSALKLYGCVVSGGCCRFTGGKNA